MMSTEYNDMPRVWPNDYGLGKGKVVDALFHRKFEPQIMISPIISDIPSKNIHSAAP
jgi:hypothetical protein